MIADKGPWTPGGKFKLAASERQSLQLAETLVKKGSLIKDGEAYRLNSWLADLLGGIRAKSEKLREMKRTAHAKRMARNV